MPELADFSKPWYHGSPLRLTVLRAGSTMTQWRALACVFSHKPTVVSIDEDGTLRHNGTRPGCLYEIDEPVGPQDVVPHPRTTMRSGDEWLTTRDLRLRLIGETVVHPEAFLSDAAIEAVRKRAGGTAST